MNEVLLPGGAAGAPGRLIKRLGEHCNPGRTAVVGRGTGSSGGQERNRRCRQHPCAAPQAAELL